MRAAAMRHGLARMDQWIHPTSEWKVHRKQRKAPDSRIEVSRFFVELGAFQLQRSSGSIASLLDRPQRAEMRLRHVYDSQSAIAAAFCDSRCHFCARHLVVPVQTVLKVIPLTRILPWRVDFVHCVFVLPVSCIEYRVSSISVRGFRIGTLLWFYFVTWGCALVRNILERGKSGLDENGLWLFNFRRDSRRVHWAK